LSVINGQFHSTFNESAFKYSSLHEFLEKNYEIGFVRLDVSLTINKFYCKVNGIDKNNNSVNKENIIDIPNGKCGFNELITTINGSLKHDKGFSRQVRRW
jgi:hypothetical protein